jgi:molybdopterin-guanine dinucleotide biosynthesis protein A
MMETGIAMGNLPVEAKPPGHYPDVTGVLLAGGKSRRMGRDKARMTFNGKNLFEHSLSLLRGFFAVVIIAGDRPDLAGPDLPAIPDIYPGSALGGLHTGLKATKTDWIFAAPCDMPFPDGRIVDRILEHRDGFDAVVPRTPEGYEPVFALYHRNCLPQMESMLLQNRFRIYDFYQRIHIRYLDLPELPEGWQRSLINVNTPQDLARVKEQGKTPPVVSGIARCLRCVKSVSVPEAEQSTGGEVYPIPFGVLKTERKMTRE